MLYSLKCVTNAASLIQSLFALDFFLYALLNVLFTLNFAIRVKMYN